MPVSILRFITRLPLCLALLLIALPASADPQSKSFSSWYFDGNRAEMVYTIAAREVTRLPEYQRNPDLTGILAGHLYNTVTLRLDGLPCPKSFPATRNLPKN